MEKIYSKVEPEVLLHIINRVEDIVKGRRDLSPDSEFLQIATLNLDKGKTFQPHKHITKKGSEYVIAQESWIIIKGKVKCILYDLDDTIIREEILNQGDCSITFYGGHNYEIMEDDSLVLEYKTGPYYGQTIDKKFI